VTAGSVVQLILIDGMTTRKLVVQQSWHPTLPGIALPAPPRNLLLNLFVDGFATTNKLFRKFLGDNQTATNGL
jgi:hypothetical protein